MDRGIYEKDKSNSNKTDYLRDKSSLPKYYQSWDN